MSELNNKLIKATTKDYENKKDKYKYARELGFSSTEARHMRTWSKSNIETVAKERGYKV
jgi:hypothetical protein